MTLSPFVECYWTIQSQVPVGLPFRRIYPDGCSDIIFNFSGPLLGLTDKGCESNGSPAFVVGLMTTSIQSRSDSRYDLVGIRFRPAGMWPFLGVPMDKLTDETVDLAEFWSPDYLVEALYRAASFTERVALLNEHLQHRLQASHHIDARVRLAMEIQASKQGNYAIHKLPVEVGLSQKQLERLFLQQVGVTPKQYGSLRRFLRLKSLIDRMGSDSLLELAVDAGYSDHAHLTKSFKRFAGLTPTAYQFST